MKRKKKFLFPIAVVLISCIIVTGVLMLTGIININFAQGTEENQKNPGTQTAYVEKSGVYYIIDSNGKILNVTNESPSDIPMLSGISFTGMQQADTLQYSDEEAFNYVIRVAVLLKGYEIAASEISINEEYEVTVKTGNVQIFLGKDDKTSTKLADLRDFYDQVKDLNGTLYMEDVDESQGYTFKKNKDEAGIANADENEQTVIINAEGEETEQNQETSEESEDGTPEGAYDESEGEVSEESYEEAEEETPEESYDEPEEEIPEESYDETAEEAYDEVYDET